MYAIAVETTDAFQLIDHNELALAAGGWGFDLERAARAGNATAPSFAEFGKNVGPVTGGLIGGTAGWFSGGPLGAMAGAGVGFEGGRRYGENIGRGLGAFYGFGRDLVRQQFE